MITNLVIEFYFFTLMNGYKILITGGTFDNEYNELTGKLYFKDTHLPEMLRLGRSLTSVKMETVLMMDSIEMTDHHREKFYHIVKRQRRNILSLPPEPTAS